MADYKDNQWPLMTQESCHPFPDSRRGKGTDKFEFA